MPPNGGNFGEGAFALTLSITTHFQEPFLVSSLQVLDPAQTMKENKGVLLLPPAVRGQLVYNTHISLARALGGRGLPSHSSRGLCSATKVFQTRMHYEESW